MRFTVTLPLICLFLTMPASAGDHDTKFLIIRAGEVIGTHQVEIHETQEGTVVDTKIEMRVKFGPIPLFKYDHDAREIWALGELISIHSKTNYNGRRTTMRAYRKNGILQIDGTEYRGPAPASAMPTSYWDKALIAADMVISTQSGELIEVTVSALGETLAPHGVKADQYRITGTVTLDIWYQGSRWVGSRFVIDGEELIYRLVSDDRQYAALEAE